MYNSVFKLSFYTNLSTDNLQCIYISNNKYINITNRYKLESNLNWNWIDSLNLSIPSPNTQNIKTQTCWWQKVRRKLRCSQRYFLLFRGRHYLHISNPRMHLAEVNQDDVWSREKCRLYCKYVGDISLKSISYELFYPIFTNCFCAFRVFKPDTYEFLWLLGYCLWRLLVSLGNRAVYCTVSFSLAAVHLNQCGV